MYKQYYNTLSSLNYFLVAYPSHFLESTKMIEIKLGIYIEVNERKDRRQELYSYLTFYLNYLPLSFFIKGCFLCLGVQVVFDYYYYFYHYYFYIIITTIAIITAYIIILSNIIIIIM